MGNNLDMCSGGSKRTEEVADTTDRLAGQFLTLRGPDGGGSDKGQKAKLTKAVGLGRVMQESRLRATKEKAESKKAMDRIINEDSDDEVEGGGVVDDDPSVTAQSVFEKAMELEKSKRLDEAKVAFKRSIRIATKASDKARRAGDEEEAKQQQFVLARSNGNLGIVFEKSNDSVRSVKYSGRAVEIFRRLGDDEREVRMLKHMLYSCIAVGMVEEAKVHALRKQDMEAAMGARWEDTQLTASQIKTLNRVISGKGRLEIKREGTTRRVSMKRMPNGIGVALKVHKARNIFLSYLKKNKQPPTSPINGSSS